jgi:hypothetical protein
MSNFIADPKFNRMRLLVNPRSNTSNPVKLAYIEAIINYFNASYVGTEFQATLEKENYFLDHAIFLRDFLLNAKMQIVKHQIATSKKSSDGIEIRSISWKLVYDRYGFAPYNNITNKTRYYYLGKKPNIDTEVFFDYLVKRLDKTGNVSFNRNLAYNRRSFRDIMVGILRYTIGDDLLLKDKFAEIQKALDAHYNSLASNKSNLKKDFLDSRHDTVIQKIKTSLGDDPFIANTPTKELAVVFLALSKFPQQVHELQKIFNKFNVDIQNMDIETIESIIDEIKIMQVFK